MNNIARVALQAMAAVFGGTQSLHCDSSMKPLALPTEEAARIALRTQQIIAYESGVTQTVDPLGGSYSLENLTLEMEKGAFDYFGKLDAMGGMVKAIERGYPQGNHSLLEYQRAAEAKEKIMVGVNEFVIDEESPHILYRRECPRQQGAKLKAMRARRSNDEVRRRLDALKKAAAQEPNTGTNGDISPANTSALHRGRSASLRDGGRDLRSPARGLWNLYGSEHHLAEIGRLPVKLTVAHQRVTLPVPRWVRAVYSFFIRHQHGFMIKIEAHAESIEPPQEIRPRYAGDHRTSWPVPHAVWASGVSQPG